MELDTDVDTEAERHAALMEKIHTFLSRWAEHTLGPMMEKWCESELLPRLRREVDFCRSFSYPCSSYKPDVGRCY